MPQQDLEKAHAISNSDVSTVISLLPVPIDESKPGLLPTQYVLKSVKNPMEDLEVLHVFRARFPVYLDENRPALVVPAPSDTVADSICRDYKAGMGQYVEGVAEPGLFWARGFFKETDVRQKLSEELYRARTLQTQWFKLLVEVADDDWGQYHMRKMISTIQRRACDALKLDREWNSDREIAANLAMKPCPFCRAEVHPEAIICLHCRGILNMDRYKKEFKEATVGQ